MARCQAVLQVVIAVVCTLNHIMPKDIKWMQRKISVSEGTWQTMLVVLTDRDTYRYHHLILLKAIMKNNPNMP